MEDLGVYVSMISKFIFRKQDPGRGLDCTTSGQEQVLCGQGNEPSGLHKMRGYFVILGGTVNFPIRILLPRVS